MQIAAAPAAAVAASAAALVACDTAATICISEAPCGLELWDCSSHNGFSKVVMHMFLSADIIYSPSTLLPGFLRHHAQWLEPQGAALTLYFLHSAANKNNEQYMSPSHGVSRCVNSQT